MLAGDAVSYALAVSSAYGGFAGNLRAGGDTANRNPVGMMLRIMTTGHDDTAITVLPHREVL